LRGSLSDKIFTLHQSGRIEAALRFSKWDIFNQVKANAKRKKGRPVLSRTRS